MTQGKVERCTWCIKYQLPCGTLTHDNVLARYVPLMEITNLHISQLEAVPVVPAGEPIVRNSNPAEHCDQHRRRADRLANVAILCIILAAVIVSVAMIAVTLYLDPGTAPSADITITPYPIPFPSP